MFQIKKERTLGKEMRMSVVDSLIQLMKNDDNIIAMDADLGSASGWIKLKEVYPNQFLNMGIAEANMVGVAAGMSSEGQIPFIHTFGPFATRRVFDQLFISGGYSGNTVNIYGSDPGFCAGPNGGTHTTWEDVSLMKMIPGSIVCDACDDVQMDWIIKEFSKRPGINYVRGNRKAVTDVYEVGSTFEIGKGNLIHEGQDLLIIVAGQLVSNTLEVIDILKEKGITADVIDMFTIKPLDKQIIFKHLEGKKKIITIENHSVINGLGSSVADYLSSIGCSISLHKIGVEERFGQVGTPEFLQKEFGLDTNSIVNSILDSLN